MSIRREHLVFVLSEDRLGGPLTKELVDDNVFPDVHGVEAERGLTDYACFYFVNRDATFGGLLVPHIWFSERPEHHTVTIGFDPAGKNVTAQVIASRLDPPIGVRFLAPTDELTAMWLPAEPYVKDDFIALWVRREVPRDAPMGKEGFELKIKGESFA